MDKSSLDNCIPSLAPDSPLVEDPRDLRSEMDQLMTQLEQLQKERLDSAQNARQLAQREMDQGLNLAAEIFAAKQQVLIQATQCQHLKVQINHLRYQLGLPFLGGD